MNSFYAGFEKRAGVGDWMSKMTTKVKSLFSPNETTAPKPAEKKPPKYFYSKKLDPAFVKGLNSGIRRSSKGLPGDRIIEYRKADGSIVKRRVTPYTAKNGKILLAHDHHRNDIRSFRVDRIQKLSKA